jgi:hypothetical protein
VISVKSKPLTVWNGLDAVCANYLDYRSIGTPG